MLLFCAKNIKNKNFYSFVLFLELLRSVSFICTKTHTKS
nr:MAG TPA: hypothetical protein [Caudoviricetes sp.]